MTLDELDALLTKWQKDIKVTTSNLVAYEDSTGYKIAKTALPTVEGKSKELLQPALAGLERVWEHFGQLNEIVKEATHVRQNLPLAFGRQARVKQIEDLLTGPSICLQIKEIPLEERGLTGASHLNKMTTPQDIFNLMQTKFVEATKAIARYEKVCQDLIAKLATTTTDLTSLFHGESDSLEEIKTLGITDPISALERLESLKKPKNVSIPAFVATPSAPVKTEAHSEFLGFATKNSPDTKLNQVLASKPEVESNFLGFVSSPSIVEAVPKTDAFKDDPLTQLLSGSPKKDFFAEVKKPSKVDSPLDPKEHTKSALESLINGSGPASTSAEEPPQQKLEDLFS